MSIGQKLFLRNPGICISRSGTAATNTGGERVAKISRSRYSLLPSNRLPIALLGWVGYRAQQLKLISRTACKFLQLHQEPEKIYDTLNRIISAQICSTVLIQSALILSIPTTLNFVKVAVRKASTLSSETATA